VEALELFIVNYICSAFIHVCACSTHSMYTLWKFLLTHTHNHAYLWPSRLV